MKRQSILIAGCLLLFGRFAWADMTLFDSFVYGGPANTPWGEISGGLTDGTIEAGTYKNLIEYREFRKIDSFPLFADISFDLDRDGVIDSYAGSEVGLFYAEAYADVIEPGTVHKEFGSAQAEATVCFSIDRSRLSLHWLYELSPYNYGFVNIYSLRVNDWATQEYVCYYSNVVGSPFDATVTLDLIPDRKYVLYWSLQVGAGRGFDSDGWARLSIVPTEIIPAAGAFILGSIGLTFSGWLLRRRRTL
jgi:hypothetical protein